MLSTMDHYKIPIFLKSILCFDDVRYLQQNTFVVSKIAKVLIPWGWFNIWTKILELSTLGVLHKNLAPEGASLICHDLFSSFKHIGRKDSRVTFYPECRKCCVTFPAFLNARTHCKHHEGCFYGPQLFRCTYWLKLTATRVQKINRIMTYYSYIAVQMW